MDELMEKCIEMDKLLRKENVKITDIKKEDKI